ncbi:MAG: DUF5018 domain-containing protein, partial [Salinivirgaceae bacterium]|nr:DUF5018 domain-containing protein [Salinivirgaceae bacterium]
TNATIDAIRVATTWEEAVKADEPSAPVITAPWSTNFADNAIPEGWGNFDVDGDGYFWETTEINAGVYALISETFRYDIYDALTPDNYITTAKVNLSALTSPVMNWKVMAISDFDYAEHYSVYVSTTGNTVADFTDAAVFSETLAVGGTQLERSISLAGYGNEVYIAFRHHDCTNQFFMAIPELAFQEEPIADTEAPVATFVPENGATGIAVDVIPSITFDEAILSIAGTEIVNADLASLITLVDQDASVIGFDATINVAKTVITVTPSITLAENTTYTLSVGVVEDAAGNESVTQMASFTTLSTAPSIAITNPTNGSTMAGQTATIEMLVSHFAVGQSGTGIDGHIKTTLDGGTATMVYTTNPIVLEGLSYGSHTFEIELVDNNDVSLNPQAVASVTFTLTDQPAGELFISEYVEGSASNKAIEIYNPNPFSVDLTGYSLKLFANGATEPTNPVDLSGTLDANSVYVVANASAVPEILNIANITSNVTFFNGNDAIGFYKNDVLIDVFGLIGDNPGTSWEAAGVTGATIDHTLVRKSHISQGNTNWAEQAGTNADDSEWIVYPKDTFSYLGAHQFGLSDETDVLAFSLPNQTGTATINATAHTVAIEVIYGSDVTTLVPTFSLSGGATAKIGETAQISGVSVVDFTNPVIYTVVAQNATNTQDWTVTVTISTSQSSEAEILTFAIPEQVGNTVINSTAGTVQLTVQQGTSLTALVPTIALSNGATINPASGTAQDFTNAVTYTVTAQDATTKIWTATVTLESMTTIYDIQYTTNPDGNSPYMDQVVTTSGIVTAVVPDKGFYLQDGAGLWNGIYVFKEAQQITLPAVGDEVVVRAKVIEYFNLTEMKNIETLNVVSSNNTLPEAHPVVANEMTEGVEGVLVSATNFICVHDGSGLYWNSRYVTTAAPTDTLLVYRQLYTDFLPIVGKTYSFTGIATYDFSEFKIAPRNANDVIESQENMAPAITDIAIYPEVPEVGKESFVQSTITDDGGQAGLVKKFFYGFDEEAITNELPLTDVGLSGTRFLATIPPMDAATPIYFRITANDGELETEYIGSFDIILGINDAVSTSFMMYPNPASDKLIVENAQSGRYIVMSISGQVVQEGQIASGQNEINIDNMSNGLYIINIVNTNGQSNAQTFIKK